MVVKIILQPSRKIMFDFIKKIIEKIKELFLKMFK